MTDRPDIRPHGCTVADAACVALASVTLGLLALPSVLRNRRIEFERRAASALSRIVYAQLDLRDNDLDGNGRRDYWTRDVRGLADFRNASGAALIGREIAEADGGYAFPNALNGWCFAAVPIDSNGAPLDNGSGRGSEFAIVAYAESAESGPRSYVYATSVGGWWKRYDGQGGRLLRVPQSPGSAGWSRFD